MTTRDSEASLPAPPFFARPAVQGLVLGSFVFLTLPLCAVLLVGDPGLRRWLPLYTVTFGITHFLTTAFIYLDARNLRYFASTARNRFVYFAVPIAIFIGFDLVAASGLRGRAAGLDAAIFQIVLLANFAHVSRQSFGVLQLFKSASRRLRGEGLRTAESLFFAGLALLQAETLWTDQEYAPERIGVLLTTLLVAWVFVVVAGLHLRELRRGSSARNDWVPVLYFALQALAGALAVWKTSLYGVALAMHYVEYHLVMMPRVFEAPFDSASRVDRVRDWLTRSKFVFYAVLIAAAWALWLTRRSALYLEPDAAGLPVRIALHALDGLFLAHFFVETFVWKFSKPHYRETLAPFYFAPRERG